MAVGKRSRIIIAAVALVFVVGVPLIYHFVHNFTDTPFYLSSGYYESSEIINISPDELKNDLDNRASFLMFVSQPGCLTTKQLEEYITELQNTYKFRILKINFDELRDSKLAPEIKFYPSIGIYHQGKLVDFLDANSDADTPAYTSREGLEKWLQEYVILKH